MYPGQAGNNELQNHNAETTQENYFYLPSLEITHEGTIAETFGSLANAITCHIFSVLSSPL
jgi:hypothetical protein